MLAGSRADRISDAAAALPRHMLERISPVYALPHDAAAGGDSPPWAPRGRDRAPAELPANPRRPDLRPRAAPREPHTRSSSRHTRRLPTRTCASFSPCITAGLPTSSRRFGESLQLLLLQPAIQAPPRQRKQPRRLAKTLLSPAAGRTPALTFRPTTASGRRELEHACWLVASDALEAEVDLTRFDDTWTLPVVSRGK